MFQVNDLQRSVPAGAALTLCLLLAACAPDRAETDLVWAVNVGGPYYEGVDGTAYEAETSVSGGTVGQMETVKGSQDATLYRSYREGDIEIERPIANGAYDVTFHFAEPKDFERGDRVFDAFAEGQRVIDDLDVMLFRDGKTVSALTVTVPDVVVVPVPRRPDNRCRRCRPSPAGRSGCPGPPPAPWRVPPSRRPDRR